MSPNTWSRVKASALGEFYRAAGPWRFLFWVPGSVVGLGDSIGLLVGGEQPWDPPVKFVYLAWTVGIFVAAFAAFLAIRKERDTAQRQRDDLRKAPQPRRIDLEIKFDHWPSITAERLLTSNGFQPVVKINSFYVNNHADDGGIFEFYLLLRSHSAMNVGLVSRWRLGPDSLDSLSQASAIDTTGYMPNPLHVHPRPWNRGLDLMFAFSSEPFFVGGGIVLTPDDTESNFRLVVRETDSGRMFVIREPGRHRWNTA